MWEREKHPDLSDQTPKQQLERLPTQPTEYCGKRNKVCSLHGNGCGHRFKKGDKSWVCPNCGLDRRCGSRKLEGKKACRMHGGKAGRPITKGYAIYDNLKHYNAVLSDPKFMDNTLDIAALDSMRIELLEEITEHDNSALLDEVQKAANMIFAAAQYGNTGRIQAGADLLLEAIAPLRQARDLRKEFYDVTNLKSRLLDNERRWMMDRDQLIPAHQVYEFVVQFQMLMLKYIISQNDRASFTRELKNLFPAPVKSANGTNPTS